MTITLSFFLSLEIWLSNLDPVIRLFLKIQENFLHLILQDEFWCVLIPFGNMVKFQFLTIPNGSSFPPSHVYSYIHICLNWQHSLIIQLKIAQALVDSLSLKSEWYQIAGSPGLFSVFCPNVLDSSSDCQFFQSPFPATGKRINHKCQHHSCSNDYYDHY